MNRRAIVERMMLESGLTRAAAVQVLDLLFGSQRNEGLIARALRDGAAVRIEGFGSFRRRQRAARSIRLPSGESRNVPERVTVSFRAGIVLRDRVT